MPRHTIFHSGPPDTLPSAYCWACKDEVLVWADFPDGNVEADAIPRCLACDQRLDAFGVDPGTKRVGYEALDRMGLALHDRTSSSKGACGAGGGGGGCMTGGCAENGGGGGCYTPAPDGRAAEAAAEGQRGCVSCGVKTECAEVSRLGRAGDLEGAAIANLAKKARKTALERPSALKVF